MPSLDIVTMLRHDAEQLMRMSEQSRLAGEGVAVRVLAPEMLHAVMMDAADEIETLRQARAEGERAGRIAMREEAAALVDGHSEGVELKTSRRILIPRDDTGDQAGRGYAAAIRALKVEGE